MLINRRSASFLCLAFVFFSSFSQSFSDTTLIANHLRGITRVYGNRDYTNIYTLNKIAEYIQKEFEKTHTIETLNIEKMKQVIGAVFLALKKLTV